MAEQINSTGDLLKLLAKYNVGGMTWVNKVDKSPNSDQGDGVIIKGEFTTFLEEQGVNILDKKTKDIISEFWNSFDTTQNDKTFKGNNGSTFFNANALDNTEQKNLNNEVDRYSVLYQVLNNDVKKYLDTPIEGTTTTLREKLGIYATAWNKEIENQLTSYIENQRLNDKVTTYDDLKKYFDDIADGITTKYNRKLETANLLEKYKEKYPNVTDWSYFESEISKMFEKGSTVSEVVAWMENKLKDLNPDKKYDSFDWETVGAENSYKFNSVQVQNIKSHIKKQVLIFLGAESANIMAMDTKAYEKAIEIFTNKILSGEIDIAKPKVNGDGSVETYDDVYNRIMNLSATTTNGYNAWGENSVWRQFTASGSLAEAVVYNMTDESFLYEYISNNLGNVYADYLLSDAVNSDLLDFIVQEVTKQMNATSTRTSTNIDEIVAELDDSNKTNHDVWRNNQLDCSNIGQICREVLELLKDALDYDGIRYAIATDNNEVNGGVTLVKNEDNAYEFKKNGYLNGYFTSDLDFFKNGFPSDWSDAKLAELFETRLNDIDPDSENLASEKRVLVNKIDDLEAEKNSLLSQLQILETKDVNFIKESKKESAIQYCKNLISPLNSIAVHLGLLSVSGNLHKSAIEGYLNSLCEFIASLEDNEIEIDFDTMKVGLAASVKMLHSELGLDVNKFSEWEDILENAKKEYIDWQDLKLNGVNSSVYTDISDSVKKLETEIKKLEEDISTEKTGLQKLMKGDVENEQLLENAQEAFVKYLDSVKDKFDNFGEYVGEGFWQIISEDFVSTDDQGKIVKALEAGDFASVVKYCSIEQIRLIYDNILSNAITNASTSLTWKMDDVIKLEAGQYKDVDFIAVRNDEYELDYSKITYVITENNCFVSEKDANTLTVAAGEKGIGSFTIQMYVDGKICGQPKEVKVYNKDAATLLNDTQGVLSEYNNQGLYYPEDGDNDLTADKFWTSDGAGITAAYSSAITRVNSRIDEFATKFTEKGANSEAVSKATTALKAYCEAAINAIYDPTKNYNYWRNWSYIGDDNDKEKGLHYSYSFKYTVDGSEESATQTFCYVQRGDKDLMDNKLKNTGSSATDKGYDNQLFYLFEDNTASNQHLITYNIGRLAEKFNEFYARYAS